MKIPEAPLHLLRSFEAAARLGGFKVAAQERSLTPAAISGQIRELEAQLGVALFVREARGVQLTAEGARYREQVAAALLAVDRATAGLAEPPIDGPLRVTLPGSLATPWLLPRL
ncbi:MAG: LysR family transcriptional regulator, partial [Myxococcota bacterium]